jgi:hypothetical protein
MKLQGFLYLGNYSSGGNSALDHCLESGAALQERQIDSADGTVALFGNNDLSFALASRDRPACKLLRGR